MCGIAGFYNSLNNPDTFTETICNMLSMIRHRGPDQAGFYFDNNVAIGVTRLNVIDIQHGTQPMSDESERYWIGYNGEIYNYIELREELKKEGINFITNSDTEVVVNAYKIWGNEAFKRLNGGFAFVIYDKVQRKVVLARDRFGERPLFYTCLRNELIFASEIKSFLAYNKVDIRFDVNKLHSLYTIWTPLPEESVYENIFQVPPGGYVEFCFEEGFKVDYYYSLDFNEPEFNGTEVDAIEKLRYELKESVRIRLRSDVEVGTYLSGGIDSSIVTLLASSLCDKLIHTFSIGFERKEFDETSPQREVSKFLGTKHQEIIISDNDIFNNFDKALWFAEVPVFRTAFVPMYLLSKYVRDLGIKVVLTGEGSDEFFLGYDLFKETILRNSWNNGISYEEKIKQIQKLYPYLSKINENILKLIPLYERFTKENYPGLFSHEMRFINSSFTSRLININNAPFLSLGEYVKLHEIEFSNLSFIERAQWLECKTLLSGYLLSTQGDRMGFANSVETRLPFLDPKVIELANSLPERMKLTKEFNEKYILKMAFKGKLPDSVLNKTKQPYLAPLPLNFFSKKGNIYFDIVSSKDYLKQVGFINVDFVEKFINKLFNTDSKDVTHRENQSFLFLLSTILLYEKFTKRNYDLVDKKHLMNSLIKCVDGRILEPVTRRC